MRTLALAVATLVSGCAVDLDDVNVETTEQYGKPACDDWGCGMNSPYIDNWGFHSLRLDGAAGENGFRIAKFDKLGQEYELHVEDGKITGTASGLPPLTAFGAVGPGLVGARIHLYQNGAPAWDILIADVGRVWSWAKQNGQPYMLETYKLMWSWPNMPDGKFMNVCPDSTTEGGMTAYHAVVFEGDVIDAEAKKVSGWLDFGQFNIGCAGNTLAKMALMGHTEAAESYGFSTTTDERQTLLKMYSADYCGTGKALTIGGQPLQYSDDKDWINASFPSAVEALWDRNGAVCLNTPRTVAYPTPYFPNVWAEIDAQCQNRIHPARPPVCPAGTSAYSPTTPNHLVSANKTLFIWPLP